MIQDRLIITSELKHLELVRSFILKIIRRTNALSGNENRIVLAVDEAVANIIEHGYQFEKQGSIDIGIKIDDEKCQIDITDRGKSFNPDMVERPDIIGWIKEGRKKGLGIYLIRQIMDEVIYIFKTGQNQLTLVKYLDDKSDKGKKGV